MKQTLFSFAREFIKVVIIVAIAVPFISLFAAFGPTASPPNDNAAAPINVGDNAQIKQGALNLKSLISGIPASYGLLVENAPIKAAGGLIIETRATNPSSPETGRMWLLR